MRARALGDRGIAVAGVDAQRVERGRMHAGVAELAQAGGEDRGQPRDAPGDAGEALGAVVHRVHRGHHRQQHLRGADVGGGLLAADVLLAGLQGQAVGRLAFGVDRDPDQAARHRALVGVAAGHERGMRATEAERHAEALGVADDDVGAHLARRLEQGQREQVGGDHEQRVVRMDHPGIAVPFGEPAARRRVLHQHAEIIAGGELLVEGLGGAHDFHRQPERLGTGLQYLDGLRMGIAGDQEGVRPRLGRAPGQGHRLRRGGGLVQQRGVGDLHAGEVGAHGLEVDQRFHAALRDLRLVGRVGRVPGRVLEDVAQDHVRHVGAVIALADEAAEHLVLRRDRADLRQRFHFADRFRQGERRRRLDRGGHDRIGQRVQRIVADRLEHRGDFAVIRADVAFDEGVVVLEGMERGAIGHGVWTRQMAGARR